MSERPRGVTIIGILWIVGGLITLIGGVAFAALFGTALGPLKEAFGLIYLVIGIFSLVLGIGAFQAWPWVWTAGVILTAFSLIIGFFSFFSTGLLSIVISAIILYYLFQPHVKAYFGKT